MPKAQASLRQLGPKTCGNVLSDYGQTFKATVTDSLTGALVPGVQITFSDSDNVSSTDAYFRKLNPHGGITCTTAGLSDPYGYGGTCQDELDDTAPYEGEVIQATATITTPGSSSNGQRDTGQLQFSAAY